MRLTALLLAGCGLASVIWLIYRRHEELCEHQHADAALDETIEESFPASDPPARASFTSAGGL
jgi:predicted RND superfamily exporter protein